MAKHPDQRRDARFFPIPRASIRNNSVAGFDLYIRAGRRFVLYRAAASPFSDEQLRRRHIDTLYVARDDRAAFEAYLERHARAIMRDPAVPADRKAEILYQTASASLESLFADATDPENLRRVQELSALAVDQIVRSRSVWMSLVRLMSHDYRTYTHSVNVAAYAVALGARIGRFSREDLDVLGLAAMLHDIGKTRLDDAMLKKPAALTSEEWEAMRGHPQWGADFLRSRGLLPPEGVRVALEHHEAYDGTGYPAGLQGEQIGLMSRVVKVADVFEALTGQRPYREPMTAFDALYLMRHEMAGQFDPDLLTEFILLLGDPAYNRSADRSSSQRRNSASGSSTPSSSAARRRL